MMKCSITDVSCRPQWSRAWVVFARTDTYFSREITGSYRSSWFTGDRIEASL